MYNLNSVTFLELGIDGSKVHVPNFGQLP